MFIAPGVNASKSSVGATCLRRSPQLPFAPPDLTHCFFVQVYKHFVPTGRRTGISPRLLRAHTNFAICPEASHRSHFHTTI